MEKKKLLVSFSGGETSAFMAQWLWNNKRGEYDMIFVFANTGLENEETLQFVHKCSEAFGFPVVWLETVMNKQFGKGASFKIVSFQTASRDGQPFEDVIKKHGIPNRNAPHCTRELKANPIKAYARSLGWKKYYTAIGIRIDEIDRMNSKYKEYKFLYPLIHHDMRPMTKPKINFWWSQQGFRLQLKGYQGNCVSCWKKADNKLYQVARESEHNFDFMGKMELRYGKYMPESRLKLIKERGELPVFPITFFRKNRSAIDIINESKNEFNKPYDDATIYPMLGLFDEDESCEVFTECGT